MSRRFYSPAQPDPLWRRICMRVGLWIMCASERLHPVNADEITIRDRIAWKIEEIGSTIFHWGMNGSQEEECMILNGEIPWDALTSFQRFRYAYEFPEVFGTDHLFEELEGMAQKVGNLLLDHPAVSNLDPKILLELTWRLKAVQGQLRHAASEMKEAA